MTDYITIQQARKKWKVSADRVRQWCEQGRIEGAYKLQGRTAPWLIPRTARKPKPRKPGRKKE